MFNYRWFAYFFISATGGFLYNALEEFVKGETSTGTVFITLSVVCFLSSVVSAIMAAAHQITSVIKSKKAGE